MSLLSRSNRKIDKFTIVLALVAILWYPTWVFVLPIQELVGYGRNVIAVFFFSPIQFEDLWQPFDYHVSRRGYKAETHMIWTSDGYHIEFHRIWNPNVTGVRDSNPVVFSPLTFLNSKVNVVFDNSAAYIIADAGFDVWLLNHRGSSFGLKHATLDETKDRSAFYNYTLVDYALFDIPEQLQYIRNATGKPKILFVTYSQSSMAFIAMLAKKPETSNLIEKAVAYGGANCPCHMRHLSLTVWVPYFADLVEYSGWAHTGRFGKVLQRFPIIAWALGKFVGMQTSSFTESQSKMFVEVCHDGFGFKSMFHMAQNGLPGCDGLLRDYDYDFGKTTQLLMWLGLRGSRNMEIYGSPVPPVIELEKFPFPVKFYWSQGDVWMTGEIVKQFTERAKVPPEDVHEIANENFDHFHFHTFKGVLHHISHTVDFFKGKPTPWDPHVFDKYYESQALNKV